MWNPQNRDQIIFQTRQDKIDFIVFFFLFFREWVNFVVVHDVLSIYVSSYYTYENVDINAKMRQHKIQNTFDTT